MPLLRCIFTLSLRVEIDFIDAGLSRGAWLGMPCLCAQFDLAEFFYRETTPAAPCFWSHRQSAGALSSKLINKGVEPARFPTQYVRTKQSR